MTASHYPPLSTPVPLLARAACAREDPLLWDPDRHTRLPDKAARICGGCPERRGGVAAWRTRCGTGMRWIVNMDRAERLGFYQPNPGDRCHNFCSVADHCAFKP